jgi:hypothetical protein
MTEQGSPPRTRRYYEDETLRQVQDATDKAFYEIDTERPWGEFTEVKTSTYHASFGEIVLCDPTGGAFTVYLPTAEAKDAGRQVTVKNYSASANHITVQDKGSATVDKLSSIFLGLAYQVRTFVVRNANEWVQVGGVGF